ncbi:hypothetical protein J3R74_002456 [Puniceicoccus vermicola]
MSFILLLLVTLSTYLSVETSSAQTEQRKMEARENAELSLLLAFGELQKFAGPDQTVSARGDITDANAENPHWTGIWNASNTTASPAWLISGNEGKSPSDPDYLDSDSTVSDPNAQFDSVWLVDDQDPTATQAERDRVRVKAPTVEIPNPSGNTAGRYAYWVGDEGIKAKYNIMAEDNLPTDSQTGSPTTVSYQYGINQMDTVFSGQNVEENALIGDAKFREDLYFLTGNRTVSKKHFHDITAASRGLLVDTRNGGFKKDLTFAFEDNSVYEMEFGTAADGPERFFVDGLENGQTGSPTGPNWDILKDYYNLYNTATTGTFETIVPTPGLDTDLRNGFNPYEGNSKGDDEYQQNNPVHPILSRIQFIFSLRTESNDDGNYDVYLDVNPIFGLYNPYNIEISNRVYAIYFYLKPTVTLTVGGNSYTKSFKDFDIVDDKLDNYMIFILNTQKADSSGDNTTSFLPGETRLFMPKDRTDWITGWQKTNWLRNTLSPNGALSLKLNIEASKGEQIQVTKIDIGERMFLNLREGKDKNSGMWKDAKSTSPYFKSIQRIGNLWQKGSNLSPATLNNPMGNQAAENLVGGFDLASWVYNLQTTRDPYGLRNGIDSNLRPLVGSSDWDGFTSGQGNTTMSGFAAQGDRGLESSISLPQTVNNARYSVRWGNSIGTTGAGNVILFDIPREPLLSLGALQHANLSRYNHDPSYIAGNSYADPRIPMGMSVNEDYDGQSGLDIYDLPYLVNEKLWDSYFFSSIDPGLTKNQLTETVDEQSYGNKRYLFTKSGQEILDEGIFNGAKTQLEDYHAWASQLMINGSFNVNSTSVEAWTAILSAMHDQDLPVYDPNTGIPTSESTETFFTRLNLHYGSAFKTNDSTTNDNFWRGYHELSATQIQDLANEIVSQIQARRRPFGSMANFVNRSLQDTVSGTDDEQLSGILQQSLDQTVNANISASLSDTFSGTQGPSPFVTTVHGSQSAGMTGHLLQGDILQALAPILTARSDTFVIRAYGDSRNPITSSILSQAYCEAVVQRVAEPVEGTPNSSADRNDPPGQFGRKFRIVDFRWITPEAI